MIKPQNPDDYHDFYKLGWLNKNVSIIGIYENMLGWEFYEEIEERREMREEGDVEKIIKSFQ